MPPKPPSKDAKKRRQLLIAGGAVAVAVLLYFLFKKKATTEETTEAAAKPSVEATPSVEGGGGSAGGGGSNAGIEGLGNQIATALQAQSATQAQENQALQGDIAGLTGALAAGYTPPASSGASSGAETKMNWSRIPAVRAEQERELRGEVSKGSASALSAKLSKPGATAAPPRSPSVPPGVASSTSQPGSGGPKPVVNTQSSNPRAGDTFTSGKYKGKSAHIYTKSVPGGVGPGHNIIIV